MTAALLDPGTEGVVPVKGRQYLARKFGTLIEVKRVARDGSWADLKVRSFDKDWHKRQPLKNGCFPFAVTEVS